MKSLPGRLIVAAALALGSVAVLSPAANAGPPSVILIKTGSVWTGPNALADCRADGQANVANNGWDTWRCLPDSTVAPDAIRLWEGVWVGCPTCAPVNATHGERN